MLKEQRTSGKTITNKVSLRVPSYQRPIKKGQLSKLAFFAVTFMATDS
jgi:hypothetical protein